MNLKEHQNMAKNLLKIRKNLSKKLASLYKKHEKAKLVKKQKSIEEKLKSLRQEYNKNENQIKIFIDRARSDGFHVEGISKPLKGKLIGGCAECGGICTLKVSNMNKKILKGGNDGSEQYFNDVFESVFNKNDYTTNVKEYHRLAYEFMYDDSRINELIQLLKSNPPPQYSMKQRIELQKSQNQERQKEYNAFLQKWANDNNISIKQALAETTTPNSPAWKAWRKESSNLKQTAINIKNTDDYKEWNNSFRKANKIVMDIQKKRLNVFEEQYRLRVENFMYLEAQKNSKSVFETLMDVPVLGNIIKITGLSLPLKQFFDIGEDIGQNFKDGNIMGIVGDVAGLADMGVDAINMGKNMGKNIGTNNMNKKIGGNADGKPYCGINKIPKGRRRGNMKECAEMNQVGFWGLNKVDEVLLKQLKSTKTVPSTRGKLMLAIVGLDGKMNKLRRELEFMKNPTKQDKNRVNGEIKKIQIQRNELKEKLDKVNAQAGKPITKKVTKKDIKYNPDETMHEMDRLEYDLENNALNQEEDISNMGLNIGATKSSKLVKSKIVKPVKSKVTSMVVKSNPWNDHVKAFRAEHPNMTFKEALKEAKKTYKK